jgi:hypothetical protein
MTIATLIEVIANVRTIGGDPLSELLAPSEIHAVAAAVLASDLANTEQAGRVILPAHLSWMATVPTSMHDCFTS